MKRFCELSFGFCEAAIKYLVLLPLAFLFISSLLYQNTITFDIFETSTIIKNGPVFWGVVIICIPLLYGIYRLLKYVPEAVLFGILALLYLVAGTYMFLHMQTVLRYDSGICYWNALNFAEGNYTNLQFGEYFYKWPHQLGLVSYNCLLVSISEDINLVYFLNLVWIILTNFFIWFTVRMLNEDNPMLRKLTILLTFSFLPQFFYSIFAYGQVPGLCFLTGALYFGIRFIKKDSKWCIIPCLLFIAVSCVLGMNYAIGGIAFAIILLLYFLQTQKLRYLLLIAAIICCMVVPNQLISAYYEKAADTELDNAMPSLLYVAMGMQENEEEGADWRANGWYNDYSSVTYQAADCNAEEAASMALDSIADRLHTFAKDPAYACEFFTEKLVTTWCEPTYQSIWSGPLIVFGSTTDVPLLEELYTGGPVFGRLASLMNIFIVFIFGFALWYVILCTFIRKKRLNAYEIFSVLFFLGGFLFHMFWETKSRYVYFYVIMLIPFACCGIRHTFGVMDAALSKRKEPKQKEEI